MKQQSNYEAPALEVLELEIENAILAASGEFSKPVPGALPPFSGFDK